MNYILNENTVVEEYEFKNPLIHKIDSISDKVIRDSHNKDFHTFKSKCVCDIQHINIGNNEKVNFTIYNKSRNLYELNKKLKNAK